MENILPQVDLIRLCIYGMQQAAKILLYYRGHTAIVESVEWSPDGKLIASGGNDSTVQVWDALTGKCLITYQGHSNEIYSVVWSPKGNYIASAGMDAIIRI
jgi:WD40 repeat protein